MLPPFHKAKIFDKNKSVASRLQLAIIYFLRLTIIIVLAASIITQNWELVGLSLLLLVLTVITTILNIRYNIHTPTSLEFITVVFIYIAAFIGSLQGYYIHYWWLDAIVHTGAGVFFGFIGFLIIYTLYEKDKIRARPFWIALFSFSFAMATGVVWEIFEFTIDHFLPYQMQENGLIDTMWDLIVNTIGAIFITLPSFIMPFSSLASFHGSGLSAFMGVVSLKLAAFEAIIERGLLSANAIKSMLIFL